MIGHRILHVFLYCDSYDIYIYAHTPENFYSFVSYCTVLIKIVINLQTATFSSQGIKAGLCGLLLCLDPHWTALPLPTLGGSVGLLPTGKGQQASPCSLVRSH